VAFVGVIVGCGPGHSHLAPSDVVGISSVAPATGPTIGNTPVTIEGHKFQSGATVTMGGAAATVVSVTDTVITIISPSHAFGVVDVSVTNPDGATATKTRAFSYAFVLAPAITAITPNIGSTDGGTPIAPIGSRLDLSVLTFGGVPAIDVRTDTAFLLYRATPAHAAGVVDVVATTPDGQSATLAGGFTYVTPASLDFNGDWTGYGNNGQDDSIDFTIRDGILVSVSCGDTHATLPPSPAVVNGAVSVTASGVVIFFARIVSASDAVGTIRLGSCSSTTVSVTRK
jgi:hypothetical protein